MKKIIALLLLFTAFLNLDAQTLTENSIGPFELGMQKSDAQKFTQTILSYKGVGQYQPVSFEENTIEIGFFESPEYDAYPAGTLTINYLSTKSPKFRFENGSGVGSTKNTVSETFKKSGYSVFSNKNSVEITSADYTKKIIFYLKNNKAYKVEIFPNSAG